MCRTVRVFPIDRLMQVLNTLNNVDCLDIVIPRGFHTSVSEDNRTRWYIEVEVGIQRIAVSRFANQAVLTFALFLSLHFTWLSQRFSGPELAVAGKTSSSLSLSAVESRYACHACSGERVVSGLVNLSSTHLAKEKR